MRTLSVPTIGLLLEIICEQLTRPADVAPLLMRCDLWPTEAGDVRLLLLNRLMQARVAAEARDQQAHRNLLCLVQLIVEKRVFHPRGLTQACELREAMLADGYQVTWERASLPHDDTARCAILPTDAGPVPLAAEISALERELSERGYHIALNHYRQAVATFERHEEAANSQLRSALEELVMSLAESQTNYLRPSRAGDGSNAIKHLTRTPGLTDDDGGAMLKGLWTMIHTKGPHPGRSDAEETRFRLQVVTAAARLLLHRFPSRP